MSLLLEPVFVRMRVCACVCTPFRLLQKKNTRGWKEGGRDGWMDGWREGGRERETQTCRQTSRHAYLMHQCIYARHDLHKHTHGNYEVMTGFVIFV
jgi:hypothetical protein